MALVRVSTMVGIKKWLFAAMVGVLGCQTVPATKPVQRPPATLAAPSSLPETARVLISQRMENHGFEMSNLVWATLMFDRSSASRITQSILAEPRLARPLQRDSSELNSALPAAFFDLQDRWVEAARNLERVASDSASTPGQLGDAFGALTRTCVNCHAVYLDGP